MKCTKPSAPYLFILMTTFAIALVSIPSPPAKESLAQSRTQEITKELEQSISSEMAEIKIEDYE